MNRNYSTKLDSYNESEALQQLLEAADSAIEKQNKAFEEDKEYLDEFTITVNGVQTAFYLGGPQLDGLCAFVGHIADENFYEVDFQNNTVKE